MKVYAVRRSTDGKVLTKNGEWHTKSRAMKLYITIESARKAIRSLPLHDWKAEIMECDVFMNEQPVCTVEVA